MLLYAIKMLFGDRAKYIGLVLALSFASFIISQQGAILVGIMKRTYGFVTDTSQANIWVADPTMQYIDDIKPLKDTDLYRVRSVSGVEWAVPLYKGLIIARLPNGIYQTCILIGIDGGTFIGIPPLVQGSAENLRIDGGVIVSTVSVGNKLATKKNGELIPLKMGDTMELNDNRAIVVGFCNAYRTFQSQPVIYTTYDRATLFTPPQRKLLSFVLAHSAPGFDPEEVCQRIMAQTGLKAYTSWGISKLTVSYYIRQTGIAINFGIAILLGFIIGTAIAGQTLYNFTVDSLPYFGIFKAMGADNALLRRMVLLQAVIVSAIGWGIGIGAAALLGYALHKTELSFSMPFYLYLFSFLSILSISLIGAVFSIRKVMKLDPAVVFQR